MSSILIVPIGSIAGLDLPALGQPLEQAFRMEVTIRSGAPLDPQFALDRFRNQYNSTSLLAAVLERYGTHEGKVLGITGHDLFVPVLTYVFGEAQLDGVAAVVSGQRLLESFYGERSDPALEHDRLVKETVHELGHTFGLVHCQNMDCVMRTSTAVEEIDVKGVQFCEECGERLREIRGQSPQ
jgi:archaemetzincin